MRVYNLLLLFFLLLFSNEAICEQITKKQYADGIRDYSKQIIKRHVNPFKQISKSAFEKATDDLVRRIDSMNEDQILVGMMQLNHLVNDEHTSIYFKNQKSNFPVLFYSFEEG